MAYSFDPSFFFSDDAQSGQLQPELQEGKPQIMSDTSHEHYAWLAVNARAPVAPLSIDLNLKTQKHQQSLVDTHGLDEQELNMMRDLKQTLQAETQVLMDRVSHWLKMFDPSLDVGEPEKLEG